MICWFGSAGILFYLFVILLGPLSRPVASEHLSGPASQLVSPLHQAAYLGHGYRFFGPNPSAGHILRYQVGENDSAETFQIPDRQVFWPRLRYHRWFMLSETLYQEHAFTPNAVDFANSQEELTAEIERNKNAGEYKLVALLERQYQQRQTQFELARKRIQKLVTSLESYLARQHGKDGIKIFLHERNLPEPLDVQFGISIDDPRYLSAPIPIGTAALDVPSIQSLPSANGSQE